MQNIIRMRESKKKILFIIFEFKTKGELKKKNFEIFILFYERNITSKIIFLYNLY